MMTEMTTIEMIDDAARRVQDVLRTNPPAAIATELYIVADHLSQLAGKFNPANGHYHPEGWDESRRLREMGERAGHYQRGIDPHSERG